MEENKEPTQKELTETLQRLQAEFENFRKRTEKEKSQVRKEANANLILQLLEVLDNFELSLKYTKDQGVKLIHNQFEKVLSKNGLKSIEAKGKFNPNIHEAIAQVPGKNDGEIIEEIQKGYLLNDKLLRASKVKIVKVTQ
jgi:molecular chaperone GrpE